MITLITGQPGAGKTSLVVNMLMTDYKDRNIYVDGITDLILPHNQAGDINQWQSGSWLQINHYDPDHNQCWRDRTDGDSSDIGALIVVDECQRYFRPRPTGSTLPESIAAFEVHRHLGLDFVLITQHANLLHTNIRRLVGRHIHIHNTVIGKRLYEWPKVGDIDSKADRDQAVRTSYKPPSKTFDKFKSAEVHTKTKYRFNPILAVPVICLLFLLSVGIYNYKTHFQDSDSITAETSTESPSNLNINESNIPSNDLDSVPVTQLFVPVEPTQEWTAPAYKPLLKVVSVPYVVGCMASETRCSCYTAQGTKLQTIPESECRQRVENPTFNPFAPSGHQKNSNISINQN